jgi:hypothetical protein
MKRVAAAVGEGRSSVPGSAVGRRTTRGHETQGDPSGTPRSRISEIRSRRVRQQVNDQVQWGFRASPRGARRGPAENLGENPGARTRPAVRSTSVERAKAPTAFDGVGSGVSSAVRARRNRSLDMDAESGGDGWGLRGHRWVDLRQIGQGRSDADPGLEVESTAGRPPEHRAEITRLPPPSCSPSAMRTARRGRTT